jgi:hypothetical protein
MKFIHHRINTIDDLARIPKSHGVELDLRYHQNDLILSHDPFDHHTNEVDRFEDFLIHWDHQGTMILNVKTEGIEERCIEMMKLYEISDWFFLDLSNPALVKFSNIAALQENDNLSYRNLAVRFSEEEPIELALSFQGKVGWVWVDCFTECPLNQEIYSRLKESGFKICLVSPELQHHEYSMIKEHKKIIDKMNIDAVCTKKPELWK